MDIRRATANDAKTMAILHVSSWRAAYHGLVPDAFLDALEVDRRAERFREALSAGTEETYLAEQVGDLVGMLTIGACRDEDVDQALMGEIWGIYLAHALLAAGNRPSLVPVWGTTAKRAVTRSQRCGCLQEMTRRGGFMKPWDIQPTEQRRCSIPERPWRLCAIANS